MVKSKLRNSWKKNLKPGNMKIVWTDFASSTLQEIFNYYSKKASRKIANEIKSRIFAATKVLPRQPQLGQEELTLIKLNQGHRYIVEGNYKIIYRIKDEDIIITDVFDCRQDPVKMNNPKRRIQ